MSNITVRRDAPVVETDKGKLRGFLYKGVYNFYGIRYAKAKRFHQPEPVDAWDGIKDATAYGYISPVLSNPRPSGEVKIPHRFWPSNEDCLNLNLWTPTLDPAAKKPVLVWYHGGGYANGSALEQVCYDGQALATKEDVIVITVNHRLNVFGFLDLSAFGPEYENSANCGIADLVASLEWVHNNIQAFGGDPENVTIFGQSGGGGKVNTLGQTPAAAGLFHRAILLSGGMGGMRFSQNPAPADLLPKEIMKEAGVSTIQELEEVPLALFIRAVNLAGKTLEKEGYTFFWGPKANGWYLGDPTEVGVADYYKTVPTLGGTVFSDLVMARMEKDADAYTDEEACALVAAKYGEENAEAIVTAFKAAYPDKRIIDIPVLDVNVRRGSRNYLTLKAKESTAPTWNMLTTLTFDYEGGSPAWHCSDLPFVFGNSEMLALYDGMGEVCEKLRDEISASICAFARTGDPNNAKVPAWAPVSADTLNTMVFDEKTCCKADFDKELGEVIVATNKAPRFGGMSAFGDPNGDSTADWMF